MNLTSWGVHKCGRLVLVDDSFHLFSALGCFKMFFIGIWHISRIKILKKLNLRQFFGQNFGFCPPVVFRERVNPWGICSFLKIYYTHFKNNFDFSWFFNIIMVKMPKNVQNLLKMQKFKFFLPFQDPQGIDRKLEKNSKNIFHVYLGVF